MKANAPEKLYVDVHDNLSDSILYGFTEKRTDDDIEYIRTDTLEVKEVEEPNASDRGMAEEIIINLKRVEQDYCIDLTKEMEWLRSKVKKGG